MRNLHLHAGYHKAGTFSLQHFLLNNVEQIKGRNFEFVYTHESGNSSASFIVKNIDSRLHVNVLDDFFNMVLASQANNVIVSAEHISLLNSYESISGFCERLREKFDNIYIYFYYMRQDVASILLKQQATKTAFLNSNPSSILCGHSLNALPDVSQNLLDYFDYHQKYLWWIEALGKNHVHFFPYLNEKSICEDFAKIVEIDFNSQSIIKEPLVSRSRSLIKHTLISMNLSQDSLKLSDELIVDDSCFLKPSGKERQSFINLFSESNLRFCNELQSFSLINKFEAYSSDNDSANNYFDLRSIENLRRVLETSFSNVVTDYISNCVIKKYEVSSRSILNAPKNKVSHVDSHFIPIDERINFYLGASSSLESYDFSSKTSMKSDEFRNDKVFIGSYEQISKIHSPGSYVADFIKYLLDFDIKDIIEKKFIFQFGDQIVDENEPVILKSRSTDTSFGILLKLNTMRHWKNLPNDSLRWNEKKNDLVWRGASTGYLDDECNSRFVLVNGYGRILDVGFSEIVQGKGKWSHLIKDKLSINQQLDYKYIICLEGNDVATSLKWILKSNSVPIMPKPTRDSWLMESKLVPFVHYVPINSDLSNLLETLDWCRKNDNFCEQIAKSGKEYFRQFEDLETESYIIRKVLESYLDITGQI